jgi:hypothetical protein
MNRMPSSSSPIVEGLWNEEVSKQNYASSDKYQDHLLKQYEVYVEMADRISARRSIANAFFLTLHTFLLSALAFAYQNEAMSLHRSVVLFPLAVALVLCALWWLLISSYRQLNTAKYKVIGELEKRLPASPYWSAEWKALGEGKHLKQYIPLTHIEQWVPIVFALIYVVGALLVFLVP